MGRIKKIEILNKMFVRPVLYKKIVWIVIVWIKMNEFET